MGDNKLSNYIKNVLENIPSDWLNLTTHRLDIYNESLAKTEFLDEFKVLFQNNTYTSTALSALPTAFDYIRLGHPLSCLLEWALGNLNNTKAENVISFSSSTIPLLAILRKNLFDGKKTKVYHQGSLPNSFDKEILNNVYAYNFDLVEVTSDYHIENEDDSTTVLISQNGRLAAPLELDSKIDFYIKNYKDLGSIILVNGDQNESYIPEIQHVRRRESIAMTPANCLEALKAFVNQKPLLNEEDSSRAINKKSVCDSVRSITGSHTKALVASSGLSIQYAILMGLIHDAIENHKGKSIKLIVPPNCYGGTNDQARRVAACLTNVEIVDLPVDGGNDMVQGIETVLNYAANEDAVPLIIAEIPTNPRVEVPNLQDLKNVLTKVRKTKNGVTAIDPVFILDQTFCPNVQFLGEGKILSEVRTISFSSGSKFPSGGLCTAGYCIGNKTTVSLIDKIEKHLILCDNEATDHQYEILAKQMPSMIQRIDDAYKNTRAFVNYITEVLPEAKINFVSEELASEGFTPSVFSLDLPTKGNTEEEKETYKRALNHKLIKMMITRIPDESKYCVSYGQLKGCYWTIPATSTQGTTKEIDKDYIARVALSPRMNLELHKKVFLDFVDGI